MSITNVAKAKQALTVALSLEEGSEVRDRIFHELDIEQLKAADGIEKLTEALDKWYLKDELSLAYDKWKEFDGYRRSDDMTIRI